MTNIFPQELWYWFETGWQHLLSGEVGDLTLTQVGFSLMVGVFVTLTLYVLLSDAWYVIVGFFKQHSVLDTVFMLCLSAIYLCIYSFVIIGVTLLVIAWGELSGRGVGLEGITLALIGAIVLIAALRAIHIIGNKLRNVLHLV